MRLPIQIEPNSRSPIYHQIEEQIKALIVSGFLEAGTSLPSIRVLAKDLECSVITTRRAYQNLEQQGLIRTTQGKGTFVEQVDASAKEATKYMTVYESLEKAIETGLLHDYSYEEIEAIIGEIISKGKRKGE